MSTASITPSTADKARLRGVALAWVIIALMLSLLLEALDQTIPRSEIPKGLHYVCMTQYDKLYELPLIILPESMDNILANILSEHQLRKQV